MDDGKPPRMDLERSVAELAAEDEALRQGTRKLAWATLDAAFSILETGTPQLKLQLISKLVTPMMRALGSEDDQEHVDALRRDMDTLFGEVRRG